MSVTPARIPTGYRRSKDVSALLELPAIGGDDTKPTRESALFYYESVPFAVIPVLDLDDVEIKMGEGVSEQLEPLESPSFVEAELMRLATCFGAVDHDGMGGELGGH